jgi:hypothetical protein
MLPPVAREGDQLPKGWEHPIPDAIWPEALVSAVRADVGALAAPRAIETIRRWKLEARGASDPRVQREARKWLRALADALLSEEPSDISPMLQDSSVQDAFTMDSIRIAIPGRLAEGQRTARAPSPTRRERGDLSDRPLLSARPISRIGSDGTPGGEMMVDDDAILNEEPASIVSRIDQLTRELAEAEGMAHPPEEFAEEDEKPTTLRKGGGFYRAARVDPFDAAFSDEDEKPTASIAIPEEMQRRNAAENADSDGKVRAPSEDTSDVQRNRSTIDDEVHEESAEERTVASSDGPKVIESGLRDRAQTPTPVQSAAKAPSQPQAPLPPASPPPDDDGNTSRLAPKPGIVRRRAISRKRESQVRPRAAMQQVKALHAVVLPLCEELIPLSVERRSRRFWARWRELAGDRGVRRGFIEDLLQSANDVRTLVCELIAEVQTVDVKSVYTLVQKIEAAGDKPSVRASAAGTPERQRGPMVGASVRVEGIPPKDEE